MSDELRLLPPGRHAEKLFLAERFPPGELIPHEWFYRAFGLGLPAEAPDYATGARRRVEAVGLRDSLFRCLLDHHRIHLEPARGVDAGRGYVVVPPGEQARVGERETYSRQMKAYRKGIRVVSFVDRAAMTGEQIAAADESVRRVAARLSMLKKPLKMLG